MTILKSCISAAAWKILESRWAWGANCLRPLQWATPKGPTQPLPRAEGKPGTNAVFYDDFNVQRVIWLVHAMHVRRKIKSLLSRRTEACDNERDPNVGQPDHKQQEGIDAVGSSLKGNGGDALPGQSELSTSKSALAIKDSDVPINELWSLAYEHLRECDGDLIADYEDRLRGSFAIGLGSTLASRADVRDKMKTILQRKMDEVNRDTWKLKFRSSEVQIKDLVQPVLGVVNWANDYVSAAVGANPSASIAWAGISLLLPVSGKLMDFEVHY